MQNDNYISKRLTTAAKFKKDKEWFKRMLDFLDYRTNFNQGDFGQGGGSGDSNYLNHERQRDMRINYNLFNGVIDRSDFEYVYKPLGEETGELPADFTNKDIVSGKMKVLQGMEMERPLRGG